MASFFGKLKSNTDSRNVSSSSNAKQKPDPNAVQPTPLQRMLENAGPLRADGSDKFWGMENFGNTCYCNSIVQSLYYSVPFREAVLSYPQHSTPDSISAAAAAAPPRPKQVLNKPQPPPVNRVTPGQQPGQPKPEDKDSPDYKKKKAVEAGPVLSMTYQNAKAYEMPETLYSSVKDLFEALVTNTSRSGVIGPFRLVDVLKRDNEMFRGQLHQDAHEFFNLLMNTMLDTIDEHERKMRLELAEKNRALKDQEESEAPPKSAGENGTVSFPSVLPSAAPPQSRWLRELFEGTLTSETRCLSCENISHRDEPFLDLSVDLEQHSSVTSCLRRFSAEEMLCERDKFHCDNCGGLQEAEKRMKIKVLPKVLTLHLKRFKYTEDMQRLQKLFHKVVYPYHLRLFNTTEDAVDPDRLYELYAVVVHIGGGPMHGHYVAVIKTEDRGWLLFDDEMVEPVDRSYVQNFFGDKPGLATAYLLFYKETTIEAVRAEQRNMNKKSKTQVATTNGINPKSESAELHQVRSASPMLSPRELGDMPNLDHAMTAPIQTNGHVDPPKSPTVPPLVSPLGAPQSKKEIAKIEKERKAAEKAAEKAAKKEQEALVKEKRKQLHERLLEAQKKQESELQWAMEESKKMAKETEDQRTQEAKVLGEIPQNGSSKMSDNLFRRSKSLRFGSLGKKDKKPVLNSDDPTPSIPSTTDPNHASAIDDSTESPTKDDLKEKKNRFSLRKKSFGLLNS